MFKRAKVVMLSTNEKAGPILLSLDDGSIQYFHRENWYNSTLIKSQLYITSDDEIKEGGWCILDNKKVIKISEIKNRDFSKKYKVVVDNKGLVHSLKLCKKIIATTDSSLMNTVVEDINGKITKYLPQPSQSFIQKYVKEYNRGNIITDVLVEYVEINTDYRTVNYPKPQIKVNSKDNTITIKKVKDSWNREEVEKLIYKYSSEIYGTKSKPASTFKWIEENL